MGSANIKVVLDLTEARRQLSQFNEEANRAIRSQDAQVRSLNNALAQNAAKTQILKGDIAELSNQSRLASPVQASVQKAVPVVPAPKKAAGGADSPASGGKRAVTKEAGDIKKLLQLGLEKQRSPANLANRLNVLMQQQGRGANPVAQNVLSRLSSAGQSSGVGSLLSKIPGAGVAAGAAAVYGTIKVATAAADFGSAVASGMSASIASAPDFKSLQYGINQLQAMLSNFENRITNILPALKDTARIAEASALLTGRLPATGTYASTEYGKRVAPGV